MIKGAKRVVKADLIKAIKEAYARPEGKAVVKEYPFYIKSDSELNRMKKEDLQVLLGSLLNV